jgi:hypothetical protein
MSESSWFQLESGKWRLTPEAGEALRTRLSGAPAASFKNEFGVAKSSCYLWLRGEAISVRGRDAVAKLLGESKPGPTERLEDRSIDELVAALKAKGVREIHFTM